MGEAHRRKIKIGPTGEFPKGKIHPTDEGELAMAIAAIEGKIVIRFGTPTAWIGMDKAQALEMAQHLTRIAEAL